METKKVIEKRRSIRSFKDEDVSNEVIEDIINCGRLAPSAKNRQNWYFIVLRNTIKDKVAEDVAKLVGHENMELNCAVSFGIANQNPKQRPRKELKDIVEWYK